ncbi:DNA/RNA polymerase, partial [Trametes sanguinea]
PLASLSESMNPLPSPPVSELQNESYQSTILSHSHLFRIVTPVKVDALEALLSSHPNRALVDSVCRGFREGFWPFADPISSGFPQSWEEPAVPLDEQAELFATKYAEDEEAAGRYSPPFSGDLCPGMFSMPVHAVPKPHSDKLRFINNHSAGSYSLNSMINKRSVGMRPDNVQDLAHNLLCFRRSHGDVTLQLFKSDVANAYRILPMHPLWQLKQVVTINGVRRIDRCCCFGNRGSPDLFCTVMSLVLWIAINIRNIPALLAYMDDNFSFEPSPTLIAYNGYGAPVYLPESQARLLSLWDDIGIPHAHPKQLFGETLTITGFSVDSRHMSITLPHESCAELVLAIRAFLKDAPRRRRTLREWQQMLGWLNWGLNVQPLLRPALQSSYAKISGMSIAHAPIYINARVTRDLMFVADIFERHGGVHIMKATTWGPRDADLLIFCDACLSGMAFWIPSLSLAFVADCPPAPAGLDDNIFWFEALTVLSALEWTASNISPPPSRLAIYTDNLNTVQIFESFRATPSFDELLLSACRTLIASDIDLRVWHIAGQYNTVADALSRGLFHVAQQYSPSLTITTFIPPHPTLGALVQ